MTSPTASTTAPAAPAPEVAAEPAPEAGYIANAGLYAFFGDEGQFLRALAPVDGADVVAHVKAELAKAPDRAPSRAVRRAVARAVADGSRDPASVLVRAYRSAAASAPVSCNINATLLAAIGQVESGNAGGRAFSLGNSVVPGIYGPALTGGPFAAIGDTDGGRLDGSSAHDRAVGHMQFIPGTWAAFGVDGDGDGKAHPQNVFDAAASAAVYLCHGGRDLRQPADLRRAILSYNQSTEYLRTVLDWKRYFDKYGIEAIGETSNYVPNGTHNEASDHKDTKEVVKVAKREKTKRHPHSSSSTTTSSTSTSKPTRTSPSSTSTSSSSSSSTSTTSSTSSSSTSSTTSSTSSPSSTSATSTSTSTTSSSTSTTNTPSDTDTSSTTDSSTTSTPSDTSTTSSSTTTDSTTSGAASETASTTTP
ncbi:lytic transglycosylase domain-containing protein [Janibacter sp. G56]|uniref:lytic transglycosylase domain-containing protein n=1 Tax=Janibacter sp. G56 TaxID=3418717 RepID=UPI003D07A363